MIESKKLNVGWIVVVGGFLCSICFGISRHLYAYLVPDMEADLNLLHGSAGGIASVYYFAYAIMTFTWGMLTDRIGARKCLMMGMIILAVGLAGMGFTSSVLTGSLFYTICGIGGAALFVPLPPLISRWFGKKQRGTALGIAASGLGAMTLILGFVVPIILARSSWQWIWWLAAALVIVIALISWPLLIERQTDKGLGSLITGKTSSIAESKSGSPDQTRPRVPLRQLMKGGTLWNLSGLYLTRGMAYAVFTTFAVTFLTETGWNPDIAARVFATWGALAMVGQPIWGVISDHFTKKYAFALALGLEAIGLLVFLQGELNVVYIASAIIGLGDVGVPTIMAASMADYYEQRNIGTALGFITLNFSIGAIIGPSLGGGLADVTGTLSAAILLSLGGVITAFLLSLVLRKPKRYPN